MSFTGRFDFLTRALKRITKIISIITPSALEVKGAILKKRSA